MKWIFERLSPPDMEPKKDEMLTIFGSAAISSFGRKYLIARKGPYG